MCVHVYVLFGHLYVFINSSNFFFFMLRHATNWRSCSQHANTFTPGNSIKVVLEMNAFTRMHKLRLLQLSHVQLTGCYKEFPTGLRWMCWLKYPLPSIPSDFPLQSLVVLEMCHSSLRQVWTGTKVYILLYSLHSVYSLFVFLFLIND